MTKTFKLIIATFAIASSATPLLAQSTSEARSVEVITSDLNLTSKAGRDQLDRRITVAGRKVCGIDHGSRDLGTQMRDNACLAKAKTAALRQVEDRTAVLLVTPKSR